MPPWLCANKQHFPTEDGGQWISNKIGPGNRLVAFRKQTGCFNFLICMERDLDYASWLFFCIYIAWQSLRRATKAVAEYHFLQVKNLYACQHSSGFASIMSHVNVMTMSCFYRFTCKYQFWYPSTVVCLFDLRPHISFPSVNTRRPTAMANDLDGGCSPEDGWKA